MREQSFVLDRLILAGGPARGGTTLLAKILNSNPHIVTAVDNLKYESWGLYYYRSRVGLVQQLRGGRVCADEAQQLLLRHIVRGDYVWGAAPSAKVKAYPVAPPPIRPNSTDVIGEHDGPKQPVLKKVKITISRALRKVHLLRRPSVTRQVLTRYCVPIKGFEQDLSLCLKSPEIVFVLPQLAAALTHARFVLVYRPVIEIAESMYRKGFEWKIPSYHRRWAQEMQENGVLAVPPGVPGEWHALWRSVSDFQRCVIYATSYLRAMVLGISRIPSSRVFVYDHVKLRANARAVLEPLAEFLGLASGGFQDAVGIVRNDTPVIPRDIVSSYNEIESQIGISAWMASITSLETSLSPYTAGDTVQCIELNTG